MWLCMILLYPVPGTVLCTRYRKQSSYMTIILYTTYVVLCCILRGDNVDTWRPSGETPPGSSHRLVAKKGCLSACPAVTRRSGSTQSISDNKCIACSLRDRPFPGHLRRAPATSREIPNCLRKMALGSREGTASKPFVQKSLRPVRGVTRDLYGQR